MLILMTEKICYNSIQITGDGRRVYMNAIGIILIVILLGFAGTGLYFYFKVKRHVKEITREAYGTDDVGKAFKMAKKDMTETPKSISRMTSLMLPKIMKDFPEFNYDEMKVRAKNLVKGYLLALMNQDIKELPEGNPDLKKKLQLAIENQKNEGVRVYYNNIKFHDIQISRYENRAGVCRILFQTSLECIHYVLDKDENVVSGEKDYKLQTRFETELVYIQDREVVDKDIDGLCGLVCPNCGGPIRNLGSKFCEYCGTGIVEYNIRVWSFIDVKEI